MTATIEHRLRTLEDLEEVRLLMARYHQRCDGWGPDGTHRDPESIADLFTDDGVWGIPQPGSSTPNPAAGREQIVALGRKLQSIHWIVHFIVNPIVEVDGDRARAEFKGIVRMQATESAPSGWGLGLYRADLVRTVDGWRFESLGWETLSVTSEAPVGPRPRR